LYTLGVGEWLRKLTDFAGSWPREAAPWFVSTWGLDPTFAVKVGILYLALYFAGLHPRITSGFRDPRKQAAMRAAWDRGERQGLRVRPADPKASLHCREVSGRPASQAIDMPCDNEALGAQLAQALGLRAGYFFTVSDPGHYDNGGL
jgi:hypothetical protein